MRAHGNVTALTIEFVAKPSEAHKLRATLPCSLNSTLREVAGFAGSMVFIADYEARLVTVVSLWRGDERLRHCHDNLKWVRALLNSYMDRCLRVQTSAAFLPETSAEWPELSATAVRETATPTQAPLPAERELVVCAA